MARLNKYRRKPNLNGDEYIKWVFGNIAYFEGIDDTVYVVDAEYFGDEVSQILNRVQGGIDQGASIGADIFGYKKPKPKPPRKSKPKKPNEWKAPHQIKTEVPLSRFEDLFLQQRLAAREQERIAEMERAQEEANAAWKRKIESRKYNPSQDALMVEIYLQEIEDSLDISIDRKNGALVADLVQSCRKRLEYDKPIKKSQILYRLKLEKRGP